MEDEEDQNPIIEIPVKRFIIHPNYSTITKYNDIALLELEKSVENFTELVRPACLHTIDNDKDKTQLLISGKKKS
jgi:Asp/Glu/hydantoin racemase